MEKLADHLFIVHDTFLVAKINGLGTVCLPRNVWETKDAFRLRIGEDWHRKYAYYLCWLWDADKAVSDWSWQGPFVSRQKAFEHAHAYYSTQGHIDLGGQPEWRRYAVRMGLTIPIFITE
jgi:hypothetical protein